MRLIPTRGERGSGTAKNRPGTERTENRKIHILGTENRTEERFRFRFGSRFRFGYFGSTQLEPNFFKRYLKIQKKIMFAFIYRWPASCQTGVSCLIRSFESYRWCKCVTLVHNFIYIVYLKSVWFCSLKKLSLCYSSACWW